MLVTKITAAISHQRALAAIREYRAYSPAEAWLRMLAIHPCSGVSPTSLALIPSEKATAK